MTPREIAKGEPMIQPSSQSLDLLEDLTGLLQQINLLAQAVNSLATRIERLEAGAAEFEKEREVITAMQVRQQQILGKIVAALTRQPPQVQWN